MMRLIPMTCLLVLSACPFFHAEAQEQGRQFAVWDFSQGDGGCRPLNQVELNVRDGLLQIVSTGNDPHLIGPAAATQAGWIRVEMTSRADLRLDAQLFWTTEAEPNTSEKNSVRFKVNSRSGQWVETVVYFYTRSPLRSVRLDPHHAPMKCELKEVLFFESDPPPAEPATDPAGFRVPPGFQVDLLYSVPAHSQGSWVSMTVDPAGRLIVCDQYGGLYRITLNETDQPGIRSIEPLGVRLQAAQGLLYAFDSLYAMVNKGKEDSGLYRITASAGDDNFDTVEKLKGLTGALGEHGPHGIALAPDGQSLYVVAGNNTILPDGIRNHRLPARWAEDQLLPRDPCSNGHNTNRMAPGGWVCRVSADGQTWELIAAGFRNPYDIAFNRSGELFTYDADMEMDVGTPWYRPTRVCHVVSGAEFGWRWGTGKWPEWACDSLPAVANIGMGSPTGVAFGYGADFPEVYEEALFVCDWTYGRLFAVHLTPDGASFRGQLEEFLTGTPLPLTDILVNPRDRAMYITIGGRRTQSGLYRVTYSSSQKKQAVTTVAMGTPETDALRALRSRLENFHSADVSAPLELIWEHLAHQDRHVRYAARIALEHQTVAEWQARALGESDPDRAILSLLALARCRQDRTDAQVDSLIRVAGSRLTDRQLTDCLRTLSVTFARHGEPTEEQRLRLLRVLEPRLPARSSSLNRELCSLLIFLRSAFVVPTAVELMAESVTQEDLLTYGMLLRIPVDGWKPTLRRAYFSLLNKVETGAATGDFVGGGHLQIYAQRFRETAVSKLPDGDRALLGDVLKAALPSAVPTGSPTPRKFVRNWTIADLTPHLDQVGQGRSFENGRTMFTVANCVQCHRFNNTGGILGPDITGASKRYSRSVMLREIMTPSAQISDQFQTHVVATTGGRVHEGKILNRTDTVLTLATDPRRPNSIVEIGVDDIEEMVPSRVSLMPADLLNTLTREDILDLLAYLESGGDSTRPSFAGSDRSND